ncbi:transposase [Micromonospora chersina]|uniref:transposase n=1 Tax=Micromonospora chersina TaxID=47854 RepID=UPI0037A5FF4C
MRFVAIDMCTVFKSAIRQALPHARLVVDHFHVVQSGQRRVDRGPPPGHRAGPGPARP